MYLFLQSMKWGILLGVRWIVALIIKMGNTRALNRISIYLLYRKSNKTFSRPENDFTLVGDMGRYSTSSSSTTTILLARSFSSRVWMKASSDPNMKQQNSWVVYIYVIKGFTMGSSFCKKHFFVSDHKTSKSEKYCMEKKELRVAR